jgi:hypothetical protein
MEVRATFDWSNLDLFNFEFFKYPPPTIKASKYFYRHGHLYELRPIQENPGPLKDGLNKAQAVYKYLKAVAFGDPEQKVKTRFEVDPEFGARWSDSYQRFNGFRGQNLVQALGNGEYNKN